LSNRYPLNPKVLLYSEAGEIAALATRNFVVRETRRQQSVELISQGRRRKGWVPSQMSGHRLVGIGRMKVQDFDAILGLRWS